MNLLVVTAVEAERSALLATSPALNVVTVGVGMPTAAANAALALARGSAHGAYDGVVCAGIGGGFEGRACVGDTVIATRSVAADLGADSPDGFISIDELGFGRSAYETDADLRTRIAERLGVARTGAVLSVNTVTGLADAAAALVARYEDAAAESMEGYGVACAAAALGVPFAEVRTISNAVGPRDRSAWRIGDALTALGGVGAALSRLGV